MSYRHQFPDTPAIKPVIPSWQLEEAGQAQTSTNSNNSDHLNPAEGEVDTHPTLEACADGAHASPEEQRLGM